MSRSTLWIRVFVVIFIAVWFVVSESFLRGASRLGVEPDWLAQFLVWLQGVIGGPYYGGPMSYSEANPLAAPVHVYPPWYAYPVISIWTSFRLEFFGEWRDEIAVVLTYFTILLPLSFVFAPASRLKLVGVNILIWLLFPVLALGYAGYYKVDLEPDFFSLAVLVAYYFEFVVFIPIIMFIVRMQKPENEF